MTTALRIRDRTQLLIHDGQPVLHCECCECPGMGILITLVWEGDEPINWLGRTWWSGDTKRFCSYYHTCRNTAHRLIFLAGVYHTRTSTWYQRSVTEHVIVGPIDIRARRHDYTVPHVWQGVFVSNRRTFNSVFSGGHLEQRKWATSHYGTFTYQNTDSNNVSLATYSSLPTPVLSGGGQLSGDHFGTFTTVAGYTVTWERDPDGAPGGCDPVTITSIIPSTITA